MKPSKAPKQPAAAPTETLEGIDELIVLVTKHLKAALVDPDTSAKQKVNLITEMRKLEALKRKQAAELTMQQVVAWLRQQAPEDRARIGRELHSMDRKGGVLG